MIVNSQSNDLNPLKEVAKKQLKINNPDCTVLCKFTPSVYIHHEILGYKQKLKQCTLGDFWTVIVEMKLYKPEADGLLACTHLPRIRM
jgi:hypothetical protein